jgi:hypothetical protein
MSMLSMASACTTAHAKSWPSPRARASTPAAS